MLRKVNLRNKNFSQICSPLERNIYSIFYFYIFLKHYYIITLLHYYKYIKYFIKII